MQRGLIYSVILHILLVLLLVFGLPWFSPRELPQESAISVEMLPLSELSNVKPKKKAEAPKKEPEKPKEQQASSSPAAAPSPPKPEPKAEPKPEPQPEPKLEPKKAEPEPKKPEPKKEEPKKEEPKKETPKPKDKPKKKKNNDLDSLLKNLEDTVESKEKEEKKKKPEPQEEEQPEEADSDSKSDKEFNADQPLSLSEQDFIRSQVEKHWSPPAGAKDAGKMRVMLRVRVSEDGTVISVSVEDSYAPSDMDPSFVRSFNESAMRAVWMSSPLQGLPADKYDSWKDFTFTFTPENF